jgi:acetate---CoA ligase (ADP-forming) subunit beta
MRIIDQVLKEGRSMLSEHESKQILAAYGIPVTRETIVNNTKDLFNVAQEIGYPLVLKACSSEIAHKTEKGLIAVDIRNYEEAKTAYEHISKVMGNTPGTVLAQEMVKGQRELVVGLTRNPQFGPCVMFGLGGIFTEVLNDVSFRVAPLQKQDALEMMQEIKSHKILGAVRGMEAVNLDMLSDILINVGRIGLENEAIMELDINPVIISGNKPVAVDALVVLKK